MWPGPQELRKLPRCFWCVARAGDLCPRHAVVDETGLRSEAAASSKLSVPPLSSVLTQMFGTGSFRGGLKEDSLFSQVPECIFIKCH